MYISLSIYLSLSIYIYIYTYTHIKGWSAHVHREARRSVGSTDRRGDDISREIGLMHSLRLPRRAMSSPPTKTFPIKSP